MQLNPTGSRLGSHGKVVLPSKDAELTALTLDGTAVGGIPVVNAHCLFIRISLDRGDSTVSSVAVHVPFQVGSIATAVDGPSGRLPC